MLAEEAEISFLRVSFFYISRKNGVDEMVEMSIAGGYGRGYFQSVVLRELRGNEF